MNCEILFEEYFTDNVINITKSLQLSKLYKS